MGLPFAAWDSHFARIKPNEYDERAAIGGRNAFTKEALSARPVVEVNK